MSSKRKRSNRSRSATSLALILWKDHVSHYFWQLALAFICMSLLAATTGAYPVIIKYSYDMLASGKLDFLWFIVMGVVVVTACKGLLDYIQALLTTKITILLNTDMQKRLFAHLLYADYARLTRDAPGQLMSRILNDLGAIQGAILAIFTSAIKDMLSLVALICSMIYLDWVMSLLVLAIYPFAALPIVAIGRLIRKNAQKTASQMGNTTATLVENLSSARLIKTFRLEDYAIEKVFGEFDFANNLRLKMVRSRAALNPILEVLGGAAVAAVIAFAAYRISSGNNTVGDFTGFVSALLMAAQPIRALGNLNSRIQEGLAGAERYYEVMNERPTIVSAPDAKPLRIGGGEIRFDHVTFFYEAGSRSAVRDFSLVIKPGTTVALVGQSGAGKSTIMNLVPRLYDPQSGAIFVDGQDIRSVTVESLRDAMSMVSQDVTLFDDTVAANIGMGRFSATREEIIAAAKAAAAHEFILELPKGYDTLIGDRGMRLSGGQRQRLALARAIVRDAPILLLDEATSALDAESERLVQEALATFSKSRTTLVIAHRLSTVKNADVICVMEGGTIIEMGSHRELFERGGAYAKFCRSQLLEPEQGYVQSLSTETPAVGQAAE